MISILFCFRNCCSSNQFLRNSKDSSETFLFTKPDILTAAKFETNSEQDLNYSTYKIYNVNAENLGKKHICHHCTYETFVKSNLVKHSLIHKDVGRVKTVKCSKCAFKTKSKQILKTHMLDHRNPKEVTMFACQYCLLQTKYKYYLKYHESKFHKKVCQSVQKSSEYQNLIHKCQQCSFETPNETIFIRHLPIHKNLDDVLPLKCNRCSFETKFKGALKSHSLIHNSCKVLIFKCKYCHFETKFKRNIEMHYKLLHKSVNEK